MRSTLGESLTNESANALATSNTIGLSGDNLVLTDYGYMEVKDLYPNCSILTGDNKFTKITKIEKIEKTETVIIHGMSIDYINCAPSQQFLVREFLKHEDAKKAKLNPIKRPCGRRIYSEPKFVCAKDLNKKYYMGIKILSTTNDKIFETENLDFWWLCGTYVGDGCMTPKKDSIIITCNDNDIKRLIPVLERLNYDYKIHSKQYERQCFNVTIKNYDFAEFAFETFGHYSYGKKIPYDVINMPYEQLNAFYKGFLESDGCIIKIPRGGADVAQFTTVNRNLNCSTSLIINKLFQRPTRLYYQKRPETYIIEGRTVNQRNTYQLRFLIEKGKFEHSFIEDGYIWFPFAKLEKGTVEDVYRIEVEDDSNGFIVGNCIVR